MNALVPVLVAIIGALVFAATGGKASQLGWGAYCAALFALMFAFATHTIHLF